MVVVAVDHVMMAAASSRERPPDPFGDGAHAARRRLVPDDERDAEAGKGHAEAGRRRRMRGGDLGARLVGMAMALAAVVAFITVTFVVIAPAGRGGDDASAARRRLARRTGATTREPPPPAPPQPPLTILPPPGGGTAAGSTAATVGNAVFISHEPRAVVYPEFLSREECEGLIALARPRLKASRVVLPPNAAGGDGGGAASGDNSSSSNSIIDNATALGLARGSSLGQASVRTSSGAFLNQELRDHPLVRRIDDRIATLVALPQSNGESLHVIRYQQKELYKPHYDYFKDENLDSENPNQRTVTVLMYLREPEAGGETAFPRGFSHLGRDDDSTGMLIDTCEGAKVRTGFSVRPRVGSAIIFHSLTPDGSRDESSLHGSCGVLEGEKWTATKWIRTHEFYGTQNQKPL